MRKRCEESNPGKSATSFLTYPPIALITETVTARLQIGRGQLRSKPAFPHRQGFDFQLTGKAGEAREYLPLEDKKKPKPRAIQDPSALERYPEMEQVILGSVKPIHLW